MTALVRGLEGQAGVLVTGATSGIGLALLQALLGRSDVSCVVAVARGAAGSPALLAHPAHAAGRLLPVAADLTDAGDLARLADSVAARLPALHLVVHAAGVLHAPGITPEKTIHALDAGAMARVFALNAFAPALLFKALLPLVPRASPAVLASLSARVGSIADNHLGGWYSYRASKAAQNQLLRTLAIELRRLRPQACCVALHPGTVDTPLSAPFQSRVPAAQLMSPAQAAARLLQVIGGLQAGDSGSFLAYDGQPVPW